MHTYHTRTCSNPLSPCWHNIHAECNGDVNNCTDCGARGRFEHSSWRQARQAPATQTSTCKQETSRCVAGCARLAPSCITICYCMLLCCKSYHCGCEDAVANALGIHVSVLQSQSAVGLSRLGIRPDTTCTAHIVIHLHFLSPLVSSPSC